ncbi:cell division protein ZipA, partial [Pseudomonas viridiflava]
THKEPQLDEHDLPSMSASPRDNVRENAREAKRSNSDKKRKGEPQQGDLNLDMGGPSLFTGRDDFPDDKPTHIITEEKDLPPVEEVLVISVISRSESGFKGPALLQNILESGLRFGEMDIFHRHESMAGNGEVLFSMANAVKPGVFDLDDIDHFSTRAVSFFLGLPGPRHPKQAFDVMVAAARKLAHELDGELKDDQRSVMTAQTIEHYRQRIVEFERRALTQRRG